MGHKVFWVLVCLRSHYSFFILDWYFHWVWNSTLRVLRIFCGQLLSGVTWIFLFLEDFSFIYLCLLTFWHKKMIQAYLILCHCSGISQFSMCKGISISVMSISNIYSNFYIAGFAIWKTNSLYQYIQFRVSTTGFIFVFSLFPSLL